MLNRRRLSVSKGREPDCEENVPAIIGLKGEQEKFDDKGLVGEKQSPAGGLGS